MIGHAVLLAGYSLSNFTLLTIRHLRSALSLTEPLGKKKYNQPKQI